VSEKLQIKLCQLNFHTGNFEQNTQKIISHIELAKSENVDVVVFSELSICGYPPKDFLEFDDFVEQCLQAIHQVAIHTQGIMAIVGGPERNPTIQGKDLYNAAYVLVDGEIRHVVRKSLLPNYDIFDEYRYFEPNNLFACVHHKGVKIALTICEDLWNVMDNPLYVINPMDELMKESPNVMINIAASPFSSSQIQKRKEILLANVCRYKLPLMYINMTGAQTHLIFDGGSMALDANGDLVCELDYFEEDTALITYHLKEKTLTCTSSRPHPSKAMSQMEQIRLALISGIKEYFYKQGFSKAIIGLSGGIDSAVVTALAVQALGADNVTVLLLPSRYSSAHSINDSLEMVRLLGIKHYVLPIEDGFVAVEKMMRKPFEGTIFDLTEENIQSRLRGLMLMAMSNKFGYILLNTSNKSELAVGYGTLYGDMCGGLSVIGDLYKTQVYDMAQHLNEIQPMIPENIITKAPSAELRPDQKDSDSLPPYEVLDRILFEYIEQRKSPRQIISDGMDEALVSRVLKMVNGSEWKRWQAPPILRVSSKSFGPGRRVPIVAKYLS
jgi:NAD+ synthase (glutamine-hydrolysing)